jgi:putative ABC transport system permease protein
MHIFSLLVTESTLVAGLGAGIGLILLYLVFYILQPIIEARFGFFIPIEMPMIRDIVILILVVTAGFISGFIPGYKAYRFSVGDGMIVRT